MIEVIVHMGGTRRAPAQALPFTVEVLGFPVELAVHYALEQTGLSVTHVVSGLRVARLEPEDVADMASGTAWIEAARAAFQKVVQRVGEPTALATLISQAPL